MPGSSFAQALINVIQRFRTVDMRFPCPEKIQVWAMKNENVGHNQDYSCVRESERDYNQRVPLCNSLHGGRPESAGKRPINYKLVASLPMFAAIYKQVYIAGIQD
jgi:hypothetical protein